MIVNLTCQEHPKYEAKKAPTAKCVSCQMLWAVRNFGVFMLNAGTYYCNLRIETDEVRAAG